MVITKMDETELIITADSTKELIDKKTEKFVKTSAETYFNEVVVPNHEDELIRFENTKKELEWKAKVSKAVRKEAVKEELAAFTSMFAIGTVVGFVSMLASDALSTKIARFIKSKK